MASARLCVRKDWSLWASHSPCVLTTWGPLQMQLAVLPTVSKGVNFFFKCEEEILVGLCLERGRYCC